VELAPGPLEVRATSGTFASFNPCFCGTRARTMRARCQSYGRGRVSILVFVELAPGRLGSRTGRATRRVSILVFVELAPGQREPAPQCRSDPGFQSLFLWNSRPDVLRGAAADWIIGFNPCFCGTRARTPPSARTTNRCIRFQSLFLWNSRPDDPRPPDPKAGTGVSILVFVELAPGPAEVQGLNNQDVGFNPCFCGTRARTRRGLPLLRGLPPVSILVFVELAPGPAIFSMIVSVWWSFNPCFCGTRARTLYQKYFQFCEISFNPCFCGTRARTEDVQWMQ